MTASSLSCSLQSIGEKARMIAAVNGEMRRKIESLESENASLRSELEDTRRELEEVRQDAEFLTMSHRLADSPDSIIQTRRRIARLIRTIDKCISLMREE